MKENLKIKFEGKKYEELERFNPTERSQVKTSPYLN
jgi:hypothetical protein